MHESTLETMDKMQQLQMLLEIYEKLFSHKEKEYGFCKTLFFVYFEFY